MKFIFAHTFEADWEIEADSYEQAEKLVMEKFGKFKVIDPATGKEAEDFIEQEPWEIERDGVFAG
jgi:hypothetical protein